MNLATKKKLELLTTIPVSSNDNTKVKSKSSPKETKKVDKAIKCYIHIASLKEYPKILINQLRFEWFNSLEECEEWCKEHCASYEIRNDKGNTLIKIK